MNRVPEFPRRDDGLPDLSGYSFAFFGRFAYWPSYHGGTPRYAASRLGATIRDKVDADLDFVVIAEHRGTGRAEARKKAESLQRRAAKKAEKTGERVVASSRFTSREVAVK